DGEKLSYIGHAVSGFRDATLADLRVKLEPLVQKACPFTPRPKSNTPAQWVQPRLVCEVSFTGWTEDGHMRHPVFMGLRENKTASEVRREVVEDVSEIQRDQTDSPRATKRKATARTDWSVQPNRRMSI